MFEDEVIDQDDMHELMDGENSDVAEADDDLSMEAADDSEADVEGSELESFESAEIEEIEELTDERIRSVVESVLFATDKPLSIAVIKQSFKGTQVRSKEIRAALMALQEEYENTPRGFELKEAGGGFQLRTKVSNLPFLRQSVKARPFRLSGPALEVISIVAYKQPVTKAQIDEIRGVESGHLLRALMEKSLVSFGERSDLPGKPMFYETTRKFLEIFGLRNIQELPSLSEIDQLIPEGIGDVEEKESLGDLTEQLSEEVGKTYSEGEDELLKITDELQTISTSSEFFEQEKQRMKEKRDADRARDIRESILFGETVQDKDRRWLEKYDLARANGESVEVSDEAVSDVGTVAVESTENVASEEPPNYEPDPSSEASPG
ncbi:MAG: SMC-Scp complex subunit ScpB [Bdellovibrionales bacterium]